MATTNVPSPPRYTPSNPSHMSSHSRMHYYGGTPLLARSSRTPWRYANHDFSSPSAPSPERQDMLPCFSHSLCFDYAGSDIQKQVRQICEDEGVVIEMTGVFKLGYMTRGAQQLRPVFLIKVDGEKVSVWACQNALDRIYAVFCGNGMADLEVEIMDGKNYLL